MAKYLGHDGNLMLFADGPRAAVIDSTLNIVTDTGFTDLYLETGTWSEGDFSAQAQELANAALTTLDVAVTASAGRLYTIPKSVQQEAQRGLTLREVSGQGGTPAGLSIARTLTAGGQIDLGTLRHIARYFSRHEAEKNTAEFSQTSWSLWGGDAAERWATNIVANANKSAVTADGFGLPGYEDTDTPLGPDMDAFDAALQINGEQGPEFIGRVRMDGSGIDRLYKVDMDGSAYVWDDMEWNNLGAVGGDIWTYDRKLDDVYDNVDTTHVLIDPESAVQLAAHFTEEPFKPVSIEDLVPEEAYLAADAADDIDYELIDSAMVAAAPPAQGAGDGQYTEEERSQNASKQVRDGNGKFAKVGGRVVINKNPRMTGTITKIDQNSGTATVALENGQAPVQVPIKSTTAVDPNARTYSGPANVDPVDLTGILAEPRTPMDRTLATLPGTLPAMTADDLHTLLNDWPTYVASQRKAAAAPEPQPVKVKTNMLDIGKAGRDIQKQTGEKIILNAYDHPLLKNWLKKKDSSGHPNSLWAAADPAVDQPADTPQTGEGKEMTPPESDVEPIYMAVVAPDDPQAVLNLIALVPASSTSTEAMTYERQDGKWVRNPQMVNDLKSATPPPVVPLDSDTLNDVLKQVDMTQSGAQSDAAADPATSPAAGQTAAPATPPAPQTPASPVAASITPDFALTVLWGPNPAAILAAGGADRNRGGAEKLRRYWLHGEGAAKIRWGTPGDWTRCVRHLGKYMGERAKGYCQLRHKEADGYYTGDERNLATQEELDKPILEYLAEAQVDPEFDSEFAPPREIIDTISNEFGDVEEEQEGLLEAANLPWSARAAYGMTAAGGLDQNRGNAEKLRRYWTVGPGGAKIMWGTGGDWTRCVRHLGKYLGPRAHGYCALRHKEMTGMWTGDKKHRRIFGRTGGSRSFSTEIVKPEESVIAAAWLRAEKATLRNRIKGLTADAGTAEEVKPGAKFTIPLVIPEGLESGDGRIFKQNAITMRDLPLPLLWQQESADGHSGSVVVGRIDSMERVDGGIGNAHGVFDNGEYGREAERLVRNGFLRGVSADMDQFEASPEKKKQIELGAEGDDTAPEVKQDRLIISKSRIMAVTIVPKPAFQECSINIDEAPESQEDNVIPDGIYVDDADELEASALVAAGYVASSVPLAPPAEWFNNPNLKQATPLTVDDNGRVFGHIASWTQDHIGRFNTRAPRSRSGYAYFHTGVIRTEDGKDIPVGQLTLAGGHASMEASAAEAIRHYDDTASAVADVHAGEDAFGIWVAGSLRPGVQPEQVRALRASAPSGDWRPVNGQLELVAVCQVNVPGFPIARAMVASGQVYALVAAGASVLAKMKSDPVAELNERLSKIENAHNHELAAKAEAARNRFHAVIDPERNARKAELAAKAEALSARVAAAKSMTVKAQPAQADSITASLERMRSVIAERSKESEFAAPKDLSPRQSQQERDARRIINQVNPSLISDDAIAPKTPEPGKYTPKTQPRDEQGKFRLILARLKADLGTSGNQNVLDKIKAVENLDNTGDYKAAVSSAADLYNTLDRIDQGALDSSTHDTLRNATSQLSKVIANLPLPFANQAQKVRFSDLPPALREMSERFITKVEQKLGTEKAAPITAELKSFMSGAEVYSQSEINAQLNRLLRYLD